MLESNFEFLMKRWPMLGNLGKLAEKNIYEDSNTTLIKLGMFSEILVKYMLAYDNLGEPEDNTHLNRIRVLKRNDLLPKEIDDILYVLRIKRNNAAHTGYESVKEAELLTGLAYKLGVWFMQTYGDWDYEPEKFMLPKKISQKEKIYKLKDENEKLSKEYERENKKLKEELEKLKELSTEKSTKERRKQSIKSAGLIELDEGETRRLIDEQLRQAGWEADSENLRYSKGIRPKKGKNIAIAEWSTDAVSGRKSGRADYALFIGLKLVAIVEAKRESKDIPSDIEQSKEYAKNIKKEHEKYIINKWGDYKVPFLFATNGRQYLKQIETKSGIWFLDGRKNTNHAKALQGWYTPEGLEKLLNFDKEEANKKLTEDSIDYLTSKDGLSLRCYQVNAIEAVEKAIRKGQENILISMATGTGKTRTVVGLIYRLIKAKRFKRILFLVDRSALGNQAEDTFKDSIIEDLMTFSNIYEVKGLEDKRPERETKVHIATVQGMVRRILYNEDESKPMIDDYDCIVVDEAHRGYILDKEMGEVELKLRNQRDYISKYTRVLQYFNSVKIALTATPALHTTEIFGPPVFKYSYREAVIDGYLVDFEPPHELNTKLKEKGIHFDKGDKVEIFNGETGNIENIDKLPDELNFDIESFNKKVINKNFNKVVLEEIAKDIDPEGPEKTLIFAVTDAHGDLIVDLLKKIYENMGIEVDDDAIKKITGSIKDPLGTIKQFKNEQYPTIAVTVDLLTTGIDVPEICNLVFLRRVKSRILYEQMLGRATRLCNKDGMEKTHFNIYDAVGVYESLEPVTNMKPVVANNKVTFKTLVEELEKLDTEEEKKNNIEQIIGKIQRKRKRIDKRALEKFKILTKGKTIEEFIQEIKKGKLEDTIKEFQSNTQLIDFLDNKTSSSNKGTVVISNHEDVLTKHTRGYGKGSKPEDYMNEFGEFIKENMNKISALKIVCTKPKELTRKSLKELKFILDNRHFTETSLNTAWKNMSNEEITADIISFIRQQALGSSLVDHKTRIKNAIKKVKEMNKWNKVQEKWIERIEKQLLIEPIINKDIFNEGRFKSKGGYGRINKVFNGKLEEIIEKINDNLYDDVI